jgi:1-acyl-sn-glycerol-3-phosphate acyltransferase
MIFTAFVWFIGVTVTFIMGLLTIFFSIFFGPGVIRKAEQLWGKTLCLISLVKVDIIGKENINFNGPQIFVSNHQGFFDIFAILGFLNLPLIWVAKESLFKLPIVGWAMKESKYIPVDRTNPRKAYASLGKGVELIKQGRSMFIFPEGTRTKDGSLGAFKRGSLFLALKSGVPIVPVTIMGSYEVMNKVRRTIRPGTIKLIISAPIKTDSLNSKSENELLERLYGIIEENLRKKL